MEKYYFVQYHDKNKLPEIIKTDESKGFQFMRKIGACSMSPAFNSEQECIEQEGLRTDCKCKMCGGWIKTRYNNYKEFKNLNICFSCNHWRGIFETKDDPQRFIIDGTSYWMHPDAPDAYFKGFGGREFKIQRFNSDEIIVSHNMWCQGDLPDIWRELVPDNAKFVK